MSETTSEVENQELSPDNPEAPITMRQLLEAGVHFGHQTKRWNPKMKPYIFGARNSIYIIDLQKTLRLWNTAANFLTKSASEGKNFLFVATNFRTVKGSIDRLRTLEKMAEDGTLERLSKKEVLMKMRERDKLEKALGGIKNLTDVPSAIYVIDAKKEHIAISEARKLEIPVIAIADTNADPDVIDYVIPGNDDAIRSGRLMSRIIADAVEEGRRIRANRPGVVAATSSAPAAPVAPVRTEEEARAHSAAQEAARAEAAAAQAAREARLAAAKEAPAPAPVVEEAPAAEETPSEEN